MRISIEEMYIKMARVLAERSSCITYKTGCVIVDRQTDSVVSTGYNGTIRNEMECSDIGRCSLECCNRCRGVHAEINALIFMPSYAKYCDAFIYNENALTRKTTFFTPTYECVKALANACIYKVYIAHPEEDFVVYTIDDLYNEVRI